MNDPRCPGCGDRVSAKGLWCMSSRCFPGADAYGCLTVPDPQIHQPKPHAPGCSTGNWCKDCLKEIEEGFDPTHAECSEIRRLREALEMTPADKLLDYAKAYKLACNFGNDQEKADALESLDILVGALRHEQYLKQKEE